MIGNAAAACTRQVHSQGEERKDAVRDFGIGGAALRGSPRVEKPVGAQELRLAIERLQQ